MTTNFLTKEKQDLFLRNLGQVGLWSISIFSLIFLYLPIAILVIYSFNSSRLNAVWRGFTFDWYRGLFEVVAVRAGGSNVLIWDAVKNSIIVGLIATFFATILGTLLGLAMERFRFRGKTAIEALLFLPIIMPDITLGISLLIFFSLVFQIIQTVTGIHLVLGLPTVIIGHVAFNISYVAVIVRARVAELDPALEEAALDLGANEWRSFWRITLPLIAPGIMSGALLAFTISLDDFVITFFTAGVGTTTLPVFVYGMIKTSVTPAINAISTLMLIASLFIVAISLTLEKR